MNSKKILGGLRRIAIGLVLCACAALGPQPAFASLETEQQFDISPQELPAALLEYSRQSGVQVTSPGEMIEGKASAGAVGKFTARDALARLLEGTALAYEIIDANTVTIRSTAKALSQADVPLVLAQDTALASANPASPVSEPGNVGSTAISGHVVNSAAGSNLPGALVRVLETGQATQTDDIGNFRLNGVQPGEYTLSISYLGYADKLWRVSAGGGTAQYALEPSAWEEAEVTIFGNRSARSLALNRQRTAENNIEVISADSLGNFTGKTISESLRRVAGVSFVRDPKTGSGTNIMIRGLEPDMNAVKLNGLNLPVGDGKGRSASLNNLLTDSISKITISKTLLASQDSSGTGGLVEIETKSPLERDARYVNLAVEGGRRGGDFGTDILMSGTVSRTFGSERRFGLSASAQYSKDSHSTSGFTTSPIFGQYLPLSPKGTPTFAANDFDPRLNFPFEAGGSSDVYIEGNSLDFSHLESEITSLTVSGEWQPTDRTSLRLDVLHSQSRGSGFSASASLALGSPYVQRSVAELGGEVRQALQYQNSATINQGYDIRDGQKSITDTYSLRGSWEPGRWHLASTVGFAHGADRTPYSNLNLRFETGPQSIYGERLETGSFLPEAVDPVEGIIITPFPKPSGRKVILPLFTPDTWAFFNQADNYYFGGGGSSLNSGRNDSLTFDVDARYDLQWRALKYLQAGFSVQRPHFSSDYHGTGIEPYTVVIAVPQDPGFQTLYPSLAPLGLRFEPTDLSRIGHYGQGFNYLSEASVRGFFANLDTYARNPEVISGITEYNPSDLERRSFTREKNFAAFIQGNLDFGRLEIIPGVRMSRVEVRSVAPTGPHIYDEIGQEDLEFSREFPESLLDESVTQTDFLPRVNVNFRQTDNLVFRGGYFLTTARPAISQLSRYESITLSKNIFQSPNYDRPSLYVSRGNPGLKPALTHNFDVDAEYYSGSIGVIRLGAFYKSIENSLQNNDSAGVDDISGIELPDWPDFNDLDVAHTYIQVTRPENSKRAARIWGAELHVERKFDFLPGAWGGLGMYFNFSYNDSDASKYFRWRAPDQLDAQGNILSYVQRVLDIRHERFNLQAATSGTVALTYDRRGIDATLAYGFQDRYQSEFSTNNLDRFAEGVGTLDLRVAYFFDLGGVKWRTFFEGTDMLKGTEDTDLLQSFGGVAGAPAVYTQGSYLGGREIRLGVSASF